MLLRQLIVCFATLSVVASCAKPPPPSLARIETQPAAADRAAQTRSGTENRAGAEAHREILEANGGEYGDAELRAYVDRIGGRLAAVTEESLERWTFTVLDSPAVNAFATQGGYVYVTRGLVSLAADEAELAGVIAHEMAHVTAKHVAARRSRQAGAGLGLFGATLAAVLLGADASTVRAVGELGQIAAAGYVADYSRAQELEADTIGVRYLAAAGYDPLAQADFLEKMRAQSELDARMVGRAYNSARVDFLASHPSNDVRLRQAAAAARISGGRGADRGRDAHLDAVEGIIYGDSPAQGFVRGRAFLHPELRFAFEAPEGFTILNASAQVTARGPGEALLVLDGERDPDGSLRDYVGRRWVPAIRQRHRTGDLADLRAVSINGLDAAIGRLPVEVGGRVYDAQLTAYRLSGRIYRLAGLAPRGRGDVAADLDRAARSFRGLSFEEAQRLQPWRILVETVRAGETMSRFAIRSPLEEFAEERLRVLNGLARGEEPRPGSRIKLVR